MNKKLTVWYASDFSGCGYLRTIFPNDLLNNKYGNRKLYEGIYSSRFITDKSIFSNINAIHFQRQINPNQISFIRAVKELRDKFPNELTYSIVYDLDDLFTEIPSYNMAAKVFEPITTKKALTEIMNLVDVCTTSTIPLQKEMMSLKGKCKSKVIPNYIPKYIYGGNIVKRENKKPKILWAGSNTHFSDNDKGDFSLIFDLVKNTTDKFDWIFFGIRTLPLWMKELEGKVTLIPWTSLYGFPNMLKDLNIDFGIAPLLNNKFNQCKSNIKILDYLSADIIPICSDIDPYKESTLFLKNDWKDDETQILDIFNNSRKKKIIEDQRRLLNTYWLEGNLEVYMDTLKLRTI